MPALNWGNFERLPGSQDRNFETLCRSLIRLQYGRYGDFRGVANQPGVEFHLQLTTACALGKPGDWIGWQCRWYGLPTGKALGSARRAKIAESIRKTEQVLPGLTEWVLWTRHPLTAGDQKWFHALTTELRLTLWTSTDAESFLTGDADLLRSAYFDELILTPVSLAQMHQTAVAPVKARWLPEAHQTVDAERTVRRMLGEAYAWDEMIVVARRLSAAAKRIRRPKFQSPLSDAVASLVAGARVMADSLIHAQQLLNSGDFELLRQALATRPAQPDKTVFAVPRRLRAARVAIALDATNALADIALAHRLLADMDTYLGARSVAILADAGGGKTQLAAQVTSALADRPAGILLHGRTLRARQNLNDLARQVSFQGKPFPGMEALVAALDAAGQRAQRRLPLVIDGLNEAEDPRDWKGALAELDALLVRFPSVLLVATLRTGSRRPAEQSNWDGDVQVPEESARTAFAKIALPDDFRTVTMEGFGEDGPAARQRYFKYFRIIPDADLPIWLLDHPLTLRFFCEATNPKRDRDVGSEMMPRSLTALFERYLQNAMMRIAELAPTNCPYCAQDVRKVIDEIGARLWSERTRELDETALRVAVGDDKRIWPESIIRLLEQEGVILRVEGAVAGQYRVMPVYDALGGYLVANARIIQLGREGFKDWIKNPVTLAAFNGSHEKLHPLATDIFRSLVGLLPRRLEREQLWMLLDGGLRDAALIGAIRLERDYLDQETLAGIAQVFRDPSASTDVLLRLAQVRGAPDHPLNADFVDAQLRKMSNADRDLRWTEWIRRLYEEPRYNSPSQFDGIGSDWRDDIATRTVSDQLRAKAMMWFLTTTSRELRDLVTRALYWFGRGDPESLFALTLGSLDISDPYVPERMLAASYGVAMAENSRVAGHPYKKTVLPKFARQLYEKMFAPGALHGTTHVLTRDFAHRILGLAGLNERKLFSSAETKRFSPPFREGGLREWQEAPTDREELHGRDSPFRMDFENYTLGRLAPSRGNYDYQDPDYRKMRAQILWRVHQLGWSADRFKKVDERIEERAHSYHRATNDDRKTDRYGKKYSWIAYHEMAGLRHDAGILERESDGQRPRDIDIDPSYPCARPEEKLITQDFLGTPATSTRDWIDHGATPNISSHFRRPAVLDHVGPWVMLDGHFNQQDHARGRRMFCYVRCLLVAKADAAAVAAALRRDPEARGRWEPEKHRTIYTFAGEMPWSATFPKNDWTRLEFVTREYKVRVRRRMLAYFVDGKPIVIPRMELMRLKMFGANTPAEQKTLDIVARGQPRKTLVEVEEVRRDIEKFDVLFPVCDFGWEGSSLEVRLAGGPVLAKELATALKLVGVPQSLDLAERDGKPATCGVVHRQQAYDNSQSFFFLRGDLLRAYLKQKNLSLIFFTWGERELSGKLAEEHSEARRNFGPGFKKYRAVEIFK